ncbi:DNA-binding protein [Oceanobacillus sp. E9]|uniref:helix-turn-helix domain-containing protein n=1 Tax=Oceanobacillus sp. E9 TaxID=1742575 RepID=UPI00084E74A8|nr:helix-turn-helix transcriptional regulator [Oceanobacillus sp. E9]OEH54002.1 DNA-binding protein [Oceanobacillus sp. E9]
MKIRSNIDYWIDKSGYKKKWIAGKLGVSQNALSRWINNRGMPSVEKLFMLAKVLNCKVDDLYTYEDDIEV